jgi:hypothetical protein
MAFDWRAVIGNGATCSSEDGIADLTFYLAGGDGERQFWFTLDVRTNEHGRTRIIKPPILGAAPPVSLTEIVDATRVYNAPYMEGAEKIEAASLAGDPAAIAAAKFNRGLTAAGRGVARVGKAAAYVLSGLVVATVLAFVLPVPTLHAKIVDAVETAIQRLRGYLVKNETPDHSLPPRLRQQGDPTFSSPNFDYYEKTPKGWIINRKFAAADAQKELARHLNEAREHHIEWEWAIKAPYMTARVFKRTENPQLHVIFDRPVDPKELYVGCFPAANVLHQEWDNVAPPGTAAPAPGPLTATEREVQDLLVISDARTHDEPTPGSPNIETHPP